MQIIFGVIVLCAVVVLLYYNKLKTLKSISVSNNRAFVINLAKNTARLSRFRRAFSISDISEFNLERFEAVYGANVDARSYLSPVAYEKLLDVEQNGFRTKHYQLTRGAIGCYLSHVALFERLLKDPSAEYYLIFEDDAIVLPSAIDNVKQAISAAPSDWDMLNFSAGYEVIASHDPPMFKKYNAFWGTSAYIVNKTGAKKFMDEFARRPITMQIDSKMSHMIQNGKLNVYGCNLNIIASSGNMGTDIQTPLMHMPNEDPFVLEDL